MRYGVNLLLFGDQMTPGVLRRFGKIREIGFDGVEVPIFDPDNLPVDRIRRAAEKHGLGLTSCGALPPGTRLYGRDAAARKAAEGHIASAIRAASELGCEVYAGPMYKPVGDTDESMPLSAQRRETAAAWKPLAAQAQEAGVAVALEPLNRFETNFMNTAEQGIDFCRKVGHGIGLLLDTFHMHIEEKDSAAAVTAAIDAGVLHHFHACGNDRGIAGSGQVRWDGLAEAVAKGGYDRWVTLESFSQTCEPIRAAVSCWRPFYPSADVFCREGLAFVRRAFPGPAKARKARKRRRTRKAAR